MLILLNQKSHRGQTHLKMTTRARAIHLKHQQQPLLCKSRIEAPTGALGIRLFIRLFKIRLNSPSPEVALGLSKTGGCTLLLGLGSQWVQVVAGVLCIWVHVAL